MEKLAKVYICRYVQSKPFIWFEAYSRMLALLRNTCSSMGDASSAEVDNTGLQTVDDLIRRRADDAFQTPIIAYPKSSQGITDYEFFTGSDIDYLVDGAAKAFIGSGLKPVVRIRQCLPMPHIEVNSTTIMSSACTEDPIWNT